MSILRQSRQAASISINCGNKNVIKKLVVDGVLVSHPQVVQLIIYRSWSNFKFKFKKTLNFTNESFQTKKMEGKNC